MEELPIPFLGPDRSRLQYPFAELLASGARLAMGSDWAVTTANPLEQLEVAVTRVDPEHRGNSPFLPEQRLRLDDALDAFTAGSAYVNHDVNGGVVSGGRRPHPRRLSTDAFAPGLPTPRDAPRAAPRRRLTPATRRGGSGARR